MNKFLLISVSAIVLMTGCASLETKTGDCAPLDQLDTKSKAVHGPSTGNPILLINQRAVVCTCYAMQQPKNRNLDSELAGKGEHGETTGQGESGILSGDEEMGLIVGAGEQGMLDGDDEDGSVTGGGESSLITGAEEHSRIEGAGDSALLVGGAEDGELAGSFSKDASLSCRLETDCAGYRLLGLESQDVIVKTNNRTQTLSTQCITW